MIRNTSFFLSRQTTNKVAVKKNNNKKNDRFKIDLFSFLIAINDVAQERN